MPLLVHSLMLVWSLEWISWSPASCIHEYNPSAYSQSPPPSGLRHSTVCPPTCGRQLVGSLFNKGLFPQLKVHSRSCTSLAVSRLCAFTVPLSQPFTDSFFPGPCRQTRMMRLQTGERSHTDDEESANKRPTKRSRIHGAFKEASVATHQEERDEVSADDHEHFCWPPSFWDALEKVYLSRGSLIELDRREILRGPLEPVVPERRPTDYASFARLGGPDLDHLRSVR